MSGQFWAACLFDWVVYTDYLVFLDSILFKLIRWNWLHGQILLKNTFESIRDTISRYLHGT
jgi:hypothetical protein